MKRREKLCVWCEHIKAVKRLNTEADANWCYVSVLKNQKQTLADVLQNRCSQKFANIQRKTPVLKSLFNKCVDLQLSCEYCKIFKSTFFDKTSSVAASEKIHELPRKTSVAEA